VPQMTLLDKPGADSTRGHPAGAAPPR